MNPLAQRDYQRMRQMTIGDLLLENRIIFLDGPIYDSVANLIVAEVARGTGIRIGFAEYSRVGVPLTLITLVLGWLILRLLPV